MKRLIIAVSAALAALSMSAAVQAQTSGQTREDLLLEQVRTGQIGSRADEQRQLSAFSNASDDRQQAMLEEAEARRDALQKESQQLEESARKNGKTYQAKINELRAALGPNASMIGSLQQLATELTGIFRGSPTTLEFPERETWLAAFSERMGKASEIFSIEDLEQLWFLMQQETTAAGKITTIPTEVLTAEGDRETLPVTRIGKFALITNEPEPAYLSWQVESQRASILKRQPEGGVLGQVDGYLSSDGEPQAVGLDPTAGPLLSRLVDSPSLGDRIKAGGLIGNLILALGAVGVLIAVFKFISIFLVSRKVAAQRKNLNSPSSDNPLGRMLKVYEDNKDADTDTLEMRLGEAILEERPKIDRFIGTIKVISAVAPLMGLMGTVIGMIATFQAITLFGTGDPKTMAGGISQALVTTVEGLTVAIPTVLLYAIVNARAVSLINTLKHQTAGLIAERMEARAAKAG